MQNKFTLSGTPTAETSKLVGSWAFDGNSTVWAGSTKSPGWTGNLTFNSNGTFSKTLYDPSGKLNDSGSGTWSLSGSTLSLGSTINAPIVFSNSDNTLTIIWPGGDKEVFNKSITTQSNSIVGVWTLDAKASTSDPALVNYTGTFTINADGTCVYTLIAPSGGGSSSYTDVKYMLSGTNGITFTRTGGGALIALTAGFIEGKLNSYSVSSNRLQISWFSGGTEIYKR